MTNSLPKILIIGSSGQVGSALVKVLKDKYTLITPPNIFFKCNSYTQLNEKLQIFKPTTIINTLAYTNVDKAENDKEKVFNLNAIFPKMLANWCSLNKSLLIHFSSDYVHSGEISVAYNETDQSHPINFYGLTKLRGDTYILKSSADSIILRCSWIYSYTHHSFFKTIIKKMQNDTTLKIVEDQLGTPTSARWIAQITKRLIEDDKLKKGTQIINCVPNGYTSWYGFGVEIFEQLKKTGFPLKTKNICPIFSENIQQIAKRPKNSRLDNRKLKSILNNDLIDWKFLLNEEITEI